MPWVDVLMYMSYWYVSSLFYWYKYYTNPSPNYAWYSFGFGCFSLKWSCWYSQNSFVFSDCGLASVIYPQWAMPRASSWFASVLYSFTFNIFFTSCHCLSSSAFGWSISCSMIYLWTCILWSFVLCKILVSLILPPISAMMCILFELPSDLVTFLSLLMSLSYISIYWLSFSALVFVLSVPMSSETCLYSSSSISLSATSILSFKPRVKIVKCSICLLLSLVWSSIYVLDPPPFFLFSLDWCLVEWLHNC